ncbi:MAG: carbohydrate kinase family protein [Candidatus Thermoplasmatota archaeon]|nr:carbohydrate kinase family protein [Euryarchaeota archaeon]MBU4031301.1 carbohydrate kinase family protein [Candidatus Thermoplasmatota archaeon]MBU4070780.1 carbohydrate kinase family protein [Candidatus Thermoplasmatota archaeon]MBU4145043.1 carbohydrate kinase family protein [Candidatus Thermoplasmatota archaeon]MBU4590962.1 carbohydrate kinase family protein [Candidatus Thermoplasmatota archaeon]
MSDTHNFLGVFGHVNIDYLMKVEKLPKPNTSVEVSDVERFFGGTGSNIAMMASAMGVRTALASFVGKDFPKDFKDALFQAGVDTYDLAEIEGFLTPTCRIMTDAQENQICIMDQGPMAKMDKFAMAAHTVESSEIIHISTGRPAYYKRIMKAARKLGKRIHFDPAQELRYVYTPEIFSEMLDISDLLFVNQHELKIAMKYLGMKKKENMLDRVGIIVVTKGKEGSEIITLSGTTAIPAIKPTKILDPTGAGDAYRAGFYAGLSRGMDLETCGILGASASSFAIGTKGPVGKLPSWDEVRDRAKII